METLQKLKEAGPGDAVKTMEDMDMLYKRKEAGLITEEKFAEEIRKPQQHLTKVELETWEEESEVKFTDDEMAMLFQRWLKFGRYWFRNLQDFTDFSKHINGANGQPSEKKLKKQAEKEAKEEAKKSKAKNKKK